MVRKFILTSQNCILTGRTALIGAVFFTFVYQKKKTSYGQRRRRLFRATSYTSPYSLPDFTSFLQTPTMREIKGSIQSIEKSIDELRVKQDDTFSLLKRLETHIHDREEMHQEQLQQLQKQLLELEQRQQQQYVHQQTREQEGHQQQQQLNQQQQHEQQLQQQQLQQQQQEQQRHEQQRERQQQQQKLQQQQLQHQQQQQLQLDEQQQIQQRQQQQQGHEFVEFPFIKPAMFGIPPFPASFPLHPVNMAMPHLPPSRLTTEEAIIGLKVKFSDNKFVFAVQLLKMLYTKQELKNCSVKRGRGKKSVNGEAVRFV